MKPKYKWEFAIGTTSRVPNSPLHYVILDMDEPISSHALSHLMRMCNSAILQNTPHGYHIYTDAVVKLRQMEIILRHMGADRSWIEIGKRRGYWFLADKKPILPPWPVERMVLHVKQKGQKKNT